MSVTVTRSIVLTRTLNMYPQSGYIWGGFADTGSRCDIDANGYGYVTSSGRYRSNDCSGFTSHCWALAYKRGSFSWSPTGEFSRNYRPRTGVGNTYESIFVGIQVGDVLWRNGHVAIYIGNNTIMQASTQNWLATDTGRGMTQRTNDFSFQGFVSFDGSFSKPLDEDDEGNYDPNENTSGGSGSGTLPNPTDVSWDGIFPLVHDQCYTTRRRNMDAWKKGR